MTCECASPSSRIRWYIVRSRFSTAGCGCSYEGLLDSSLFVSFAFLSAADTKKVRLNNVVSNNKNRLRPCMPNSSLQRKAAEYQNCSANVKSHCAHLFVRLWRGPFVSMHLWFRC